MGTCVLTLIFLSLGIVGLRARVISIKPTKGSGDKIVCCDDDSLTSCEPVTFDASRLGKDSVSLPGDLILNFISDEKEAGGRVFYYESTEGASFTFNCKKDKDNHHKTKDSSRKCSGRGSTTDGEAVMLELCGTAGYVWQVLNPEKLQEEEPLDDDPDTQSVTGASLNLGEASL